MKVGPLYHEGRWWNFNSLNVIGEINRSAWSSLLIAQLSKGLEGSLTKTYFFVWVLGDFRVLWARLVSSFSNR